MKNDLYRLGLMVLIGIALGLCLFGCAGSPTTEWAKQRESLTTVETQLAPAVASGRLTPSEIDVANNGVLAWRAALEDAKAHLPAGNGGFKGDLDIAKAVAKRLADTYLAAPAATQPSR